MSTTYTPTLTADRKRSIDDVIAGLVNADRASASWRQFEKRKRHLRSLIETMGGSARDVDDAIAAYLKGVGL